MRELYDKLHANHLYSKTYDEFKNQYSTEKAQRRMYDLLHANHKYSKSYEEFRKQYLDKDTTAQAGATNKMNNTIDVAEETTPALLSKNQKPYSYIGKGIEPKLGETNWETTFSVNEDERGNVDMKTEIKPNERGEKLMDMSANAGKEAKEQKLDIEDTLANARVYSSDNGIENMNNATATAIDYFADQLERKSQNVQNKKDYGEVFGALMNFGGGFVENVTNAVPVAGDAYNAVKSSETIYALNNLADKVQKDEPLTPEEQALYNVFVAYQNNIGRLEEEGGWGDSMGEGVATSLGLMGGMALSGASKAATAGSKVALKGAIRLLGDNIAKKGIVRKIAKGTGAMAGAGIRDSYRAGLPRIVDSYADNLINNEMKESGGDLRRWDVTGGDYAAQLAKAVGQNIVESGSEFALGNSVDALTKKLGEKIGLDKAGEVISRLMSKETIDRAKKMLAKTGVSGISEEIAEELLAGTINAQIDAMDDQTTWTEAMSDVWSPEALLQTAVGTALGVGAAKGAVYGVGALMNTPNRIERSMRKMTLGQDYTNAINSIRADKSINGDFIADAIDNGRGDVILQEMVDSGEYSNEQIDGVKKAVFTKKLYDRYDNQYQEQLYKGVKNRQSFDEGVRAGERVNDANLGEDGSSIIDLRRLSTDEDYKKGVERAFAERVANNIASGQMSVNNALQAVQHKDGNVYEANYGVNGETKECYIVDGNVAVDSNGRVDASQSDGTVIVKMYDQERGVWETKQMSPTELNDIKSEAGESIRQRNYTNIANQMNDWRTRLETSIGQQITQLQEEEAKRQSQETNQPQAQEQSQPQTQPAQTQSAQEGDTNNIEQPQEQEQAQQQTQPQAKEEEQYQDEKMQTDNGIELGEVVEYEGKEGEVVSIDNDGVVVFLGDKSVKVSPNKLTKKVGASNSNETAEQAVEQTNQQEPVVSQLEQDIADAEEFIAMGDNDYVADNISLAQKRVENANKAKPKSGEKAKRLAELQAINEEKAQAQAELDRWKKVQEEMERRANMQTQVVEQEASDNLTDNVKTDSGKGQVGESTEKVVGEDQSSLTNNKKEGSVIGHTPKDVTTSSAERQGLDYEQSNKAETATKGSGITPQSTSSLGEDSKNSETTKEVDIKEPTYTEETLENGDNDASPNAENQDKRFSVKGEEKRKNEKESVSESESESGEKGEIDLSNKNWVVRLTEEEKREEIAQLSEELGVEIHAIQDVSELPETENRAKEAIEKGGGVVRAWINVNSGEVYVYMPNVETATSLRESVMHEVVGHKGLSELYKGDEKGYETKIKEIWDMMRPEDKSSYLDYALRNNLNVSPQKIASIYMSAGEIGLEESLKRHGVDVDRVKTDTAEEYVAHLAEWGLWNAFAFEGTDKSVWRKMVDFVLDKVFKSKAPEVAVAKLLYNSRHNYEKMKRNLDPLVTAEESVNKDKVNKFADDKIEDERRRFSVKATNDRFNEELQQQIDGTLPKGHVYQLGMPGEILISAGIPNLPIEMASQRLIHKSNQENHPFDLSEVKNLPNAIHNPLAVFDSATHLGSNVILTELKQGNKNFVVVIQTNRSQGRIIVNSIRSIHPRTTSNIIGWINEGLMGYSDKKNLLDWIENKIKTRDYLNSSNPADVRNQLVSATKIVKDFENPSVEDITPKNTTIDDVLRYSIKVNHNSPYLLKRADGSFVDPETGERLGFDHRFMGKGEGAQVHGYGSYFSVNDLRHYGDIRRKQIKKVKFGKSKWYEFGQSSSEDSEGNIAMYVMDKIDFHGNSDKALAYSKKTLEHNKHALDMERVRRTYQLSKATDAKEVKEITEYSDEQIARLENEIKFTEKVISFLEQLPYTTPSKIQYKQEQDSAHHYEVEIPDNTGSNYIREKGLATKRLYNRIIKQAKKEGLSDWYISIMEEEKGNAGIYPNHIYERTAEEFEYSERKASEFLSRAGIVGIHYYGDRDGECYVIFNENDAKIVDHTRFSVLSKDAYDRKREWAARRMTNNAEIGQANGLTEEQTDLLEKLASLRHELHTSQDSYINGNSDILNRLVALNKRMAENDIAMPFIPTDTSDYIDIDNIDILKELDWDNEIPESDTEEYQDWYDENYNRIYGELEDLNRQIESFLGGIDERYGTSYRPSGYTRFSVKEAVEQELAEIKAKAIADGTFMKAPNGKPSNLGERQWLHVRLKSFKKWFGDWEKAARIEKLRKSKPLSFTGKEYEGKYELNNQSAERYILDNLRGEYSNKDTGEKILISRKSTKVMHHDAENDIHLKSIAYIPQMIENATFIAEEENLKSKNGFDSFKYYVVGLNIGGENYTAKLAIGSKDGQTYYDHALTEIEKSDLINQIDLVKAEVYGDKDALSGVKDKRLVSILQTNSSKIVDENGEPMEVWHGSPNDFNVFDNEKALRGFYFAPPKRRDSVAGYYGEGKERAFFLNIKNPIEVTPNEKPKDNKLPENKDGWVVRADKEWNRKYYNYRTKELEEEAVEKGDVVEIIAFEPNQIKSSTDNVGTYDSTNPDIRFSVSRDKNLIAVHNLTEGNLRKVIDMGSLVMPSIAITNTEIGHTSFGDISLLFRKETINPSDRRNKVYGGDAWTPRFPQLEPKLKESVIKNFGDKIYDLLSDTRLGELYNVSSEVHESNISDNIRRGGVDSYYNKEFMKHAYLLDKGKKVKIPMKPYDYGEYADVVIDLAKARGISLSDINNGGFDFYKNNEDFVNELNERIIDNEVSSLSISEEDKEKMRGLLRKDGMAFGKFDSLVRQASVKERDLNNGGFKEVVDRQALIEDVNSRVKTTNANYRKWVNDLFDGIIEKYGIRNSKEWYTPSGTPRSWETLYDNVTPSNILKHMLSKAQQGGGQGVFNSSIFGASAEEYSSIDEIRERGKARLREEDKKSYEDWTGSVYNRLSGIGRDVLGDDSSFGDRMDFNENIIEAVSKDKTAKGIYKKIKRYYPGFTMSHANEIEGIVKEIQDHAIGYFEAKPQRIVSLSEVAKAVVPTGTSADIVDGLKGYGVEVVTYRKGNDNAHKRAIDRASKDTRFSVENKNQEVFVSNAQRAVEGIKQDKATPEQWLKMIEKQGGLKAGEDKWLGLSDWLKASDKKSITKQEILDFIGENKIQIEEVKYGNDGLRRLQGEFDELLASNGGDPDVAFEEMIERYGDDFGMTMDVDGTTLSVIDGFEDYLEGFSESRGINSTRLNYTTEGLDNKREIALTVPTIESWNESDDVHFGDAGEGRAVAWVRFGETTDSDGNRVLVIDEIQSKRHQEGREKGYSKNEANKAFEVFRDNLMEKYNLPSDQIYKALNSEEKEEYDKLLTAANEEFRTSSDVPSAPFEKNWHELAMKRMLRLAAEEGYDKVAWTKGEQQAKRYDMLKAVSKIVRRDNSLVEGKRFLLVGDTVVPHKITVNDEGIIVASTIENIEGKPLSEVMGKDVSLKMMQMKNEASLDSANLRIGGEGMKGFYDEILPRFMNKYGKKWGTKVEDVELPNVEEAGRVMHSVAVTEEMRESVMEGQVMFSRKSVNDKFNTELQQQIDGTLPKGHVYQLGMPSEILRSCGFPDMPIELSSTNLAEHARKTHHPFELKDVKDLVNALQEPIGVFAYGDKEKSQNVIVEIQKDGRNFLVGVHFNQDRRGLVVSDIRGIFPKDNAEWLNWINQGKSLYLDKEKIQDLIDKQRKTLAEVAYLDLDSVANVIKDFENPSVEEEKTRFSVGRYDRETIRFKMSRTAEEFEATQRQAVEEKGIVMPGLNNTIVNVVDVPRHDFTGTGKDALRKAEDWSNKNIIGEHIYHKGQEDEFKYTIDKDAIGKFLSKSSTTESDNLGVHLAVLKKLPEVIDNSIDVEIHPDYKKVDNKRSADNGVGNEDLLVHRMYGAVSIDGRIYRAKTTIHEFKNKDNRAYDYKITEVELIISGSSTSNALNSSTSVSATKILKDVEKSYDKGKKILEVSENLSNGIRFSVDISREMYNREMGRTLSKYKEGWIDSMRSLLKAQEAVVGNGELADYENAYYAANTMSSKATAKARLYEKQYVRPMLAEVSALIGKGSSYEEVGQYVKTKHGLERNREMSLRSALKEEFKHDSAVDAAMDGYRKQKKSLQNMLNAGLMSFDDYEKACEELAIKTSPLYESHRKDYSGLSSMYDEEHYTEEAKKFCKEYEADFDVLPLWHRIRMTSERVLRYGYVSGVMSKAQYESMRDMYSFYVPLRGFNEEQAEDVYSYYGRDNRLGTTGSAYRQAKGRVSEAEDPFANLAQIGQQAILQGEKNIVKRTFYYMSQNHPSELLRAKECWYENVGTPSNPKWELKTADIPEGATEDEIVDILEQFEKDMQAKKAMGLARQDKKGLSIEYPIHSNNAKKQHEVVCKIGGRDYVVYVNGDPSVAQAINGQNKERVDLGSVGKAYNKAARYMKGVITSYSPVFIVRNFTRDTLWSNQSIFVTEDLSYYVRFVKNQKYSISNIRRLIKEYESGVAPYDEASRYLKEFIEEGGETGYFSVDEFDSIKRRLKREARAISNGASVFDKISRADDTISEMNRAIEACNRFAVYMTSRQKGRSIERSVNDAKEVTLNFNRKGSGAKGNAWANLLYFFMNPSIQGLRRQIELMTKHPIKFSITMAPVFALGLFLQEAFVYIFNSLFGGDDDEVLKSYEMLPEEKKRDNLVIPIGGSKFIYIPMPMEHRLYKGMGMLIAKGVKGELAEENVLLEILELISQTLPIDVAGDNMPFVPDVTAPLWAVYTNTNYLGRKIYSDKSEWNKYDNTPAYKQGNKNTPYVYVKISEFLNYITGGDEYSKGLIDINPSIMEYLVKSYTGGVYNLATQTALTALGIGRGVYSYVTEGEWTGEVAYRNLPVVSGFITDVSEYPSSSGVDKSYEYWKREEAKQKSSLRQMYKDKDVNYYDYFDSSRDYYSTYQPIINANAYISDIYKSMDELSEEEQKEARLRIIEIKKEAIKEMREREQ